MLNSQTVATILGAVRDLREAEDKLLWLLEELSSAEKTTINYNLGPIDAESFIWGDFGSTAGQGDDLSYSSGEPRESADDHDQSERPEGASG